MKLKGFGVGILLILSAQLYAMPVGDLLRGGVHGIDQLIRKSSQSIGHEAQQQISESLLITLKAFNRGKVPNSKTSWSKILSSDPKLLALLKKDVDDFSSQDLAKLVNRLSITAEKKARGPFLMCGACVSDELFQMGIIALSKKTSRATSRVLRMVPRNAKVLNKRIKRMAGVLNIPHISDTLNSIADVDKRRFYVALSKMSMGNKDEKALGIALRNFNIADGHNFFGENKLYTLMTDQLSPEDMHYWTKTLNEVAKEKPIDSKRGRVANLERWFNKKAQENPSLKDSLERMKKKNCWKIFK